MSDFRRTGDYLRKKYNTAIEVTMNQDGTGFKVADKDFKGSTKNELVYVENSPDYCLMDRTTGEWVREEILHVFATESWDYDSNKRGTSKNSLQRNIVWAIYHQTSSKGFKTQRQWLVSPKKIS